MSMGTELVALFAANGLGESQKTLFINAIPASPAVCGAVYESGGSAPDLGFGVPGIQHEHPTAQIRFRGASGDSDGPRVKAQTAYRLCAQQQAKTLSGTVYLLLRPLQSPFRDGPPDKNGCVEWLFNVIADKELSAAP